MKSNLTAFLIVFLVLTTGCGYSFETDETLEAYLDVVANIERSNSIVRRSTISSIRQMDELFDGKPEFQPLSEAAREVLKTVEEFNNYIDKTNEKFYNLTKNRTDKSEGYFQHLNKNTLRNQQPVNDFFITGYYDKNQNFIEPKSEKIKNKLVDTHRKIMHILDTLSSRNYFYIKDDEKIELASKWILPNPDILSTKNNWIDDTFSDKSVAATFANLVLLENDALLTAQMTIRYLGAKIGGCGPIFDKFVVVSSPRKNYVKMGETFQADIFLSAASSQAEVTAKVNGKTYPLDRGVILYETKSNSYGTHTYEAEISIKNPHTKKVEIFTKTFQYEVGECYN